MKWAAVEVKSFGKEPLEMDTYTMKGGLYAKFLHQGPAIIFHETLEYIHKEWMPASEYQLDDREHFERLDEHYNPANPNAVEEVWIPIKRGTDL
ncbi:GyrI-like domain-containing protein [Rossellomorea vietnamensis]|uniref:GyrI-like domain-containing protein n=1 Tax=Rossellomorea vietnamensis TaxID=218284 RepID=A0ACD4CC21_9BACI|nr:GyrI-like domain-containing protein [Rossellomorea vietnamensis]UXH46176.1 GyrI-like domain-containing protein [Rossellomorea vietnamensis]